jgi:putative spermidine/putrescine transport system ATP-binding protein
MLGLAQTGLSRSQRVKRAFEALTTCKAGELAERKPGTLSIGQQQRVALARAIAVRPRLLLLDEPFSSLDPGVKGELLGEVQTLSRDFDMALVVVTHDVFDALALFANGLVIEDGGVKERGELSALFAKPESAFMRACTVQLTSMAAGNPTSR